MTEVVKVIPSYLFLCVWIFTHPYFCLSIRPSVFLSVCLCVSIFTSRRSETSQMKSLTYTIYLLYDDVSFLKKSITREVYSRRMKIYCYMFVFSRYTNRESIVHQIKKKIEKMQTVHVYRFESLAPKIMSDKRLIPSSRFFLSLSRRNCQSFGFFAVFENLR